MPHGQKRESGNRRAGFSEGGSKGDAQELLSVSFFFLFSFRYNSHPIKFTLLKCAVLWMVFFSSQAFSLPIQFILLNLLFCEVCIFLMLNGMGLLKIMYKSLQHKSVQLFFNYPVTVFYMTHFQTLKHFFKEISDGFLHCFPGNDESCSFLTLSFLLGFV